MASRENPTPGPQGFFRWAYILLLFPVMVRALVGWVGNTDLRAAQGDESAGSGQRGRDQLQLTLHISPGTPMMGADLAVAMTAALLKLAALRGGAGDGQE